MGGNCCKVSTQSKPSKIIVMFGKCSCELQYVPDTYDELQQSIAALAFSHLQNYNPMDYFTLSYNKKKEGTSLRIGDDKHYRLAQRQSGSSGLVIQLKKNSFADLFELKLEDTGDETIDSKIRNLKNTLAKSQDCVMGFFKAVYELLQFTSRLSVHLQYHSIKYALTGLLLTLITEARGDLSSIGLRFSLANPYIEVYRDSLSSFSIDIIRMWNDAMYELKVLEPDADELYERFKELKEITEERSYSEQFNDTHEAKLKSKNLFILYKEAKKGFDISKELKTKLDCFIDQVRDTIEDLQTEEGSSILQKVASISETAMVVSLDEALCQYRLRPSIRLGTFKEAVKYHDDIRDSEVD